MANVSKMFSTKKETKDGNTVDILLAAVQLDLLASRAELKDKARIKRRKDSGEKFISGLEKRFGAMPLARRLVSASDSIYFAVNHKWATGIVLLGIVVSCVIPGLNTYEHLTDTLALTVLKFCVFAVFVLEFLAKLASEHCRPWKYFQGGSDQESNIMNIFDFFVVITCFPLMPPGVYAVSALRGFRLLYFVNLMSTSSRVKVSRFQILINGIAGGLESLVYVALLIILLVYVMAVVCILWFRQNDPWHWGTMGRALATLLRMMTYDDWTDVLYINLYGCSTFPSSYYALPNQTASDGLMRCDTPMAQPVASLVFMCSFMMLSIMMLAMFVGAVSVSMGDAVEEMQHNLKREERQIRRVKGTLALTHQLQQGGIRSWWEFEKTAAGLESINMRLRVGALLRQAYEGVPFPLEIFVGEDGELLHSMWRQRMHWGFVKAVRRVVHSSNFDSLLLCVIFIAAINLGYLTTYNRQIFPDCERVCSILFAFELITKLIAQGHTPSKHFFHDKTYFAGEAPPTGWDKLGRPKYWNCIDLIVIVAMLLNESLQVFLLLRVLQVVEVSHHFPKLQVVARTFVEAADVMVYMLMLMGLLLYLFGVIAVPMFRDNDPWHFRNLDIAMVSLFRCATLEDWSDLLYINIYGCKNYQHEFVETYTCSEGRLPVYWATVTYFLLFIVLSHFLLLNTLTGVIIVAFGQVVKEMKREHILRQRIASVEKTFVMSHSHVNFLRRAFALINIEGQNAISVEALQVGLQGADVSMTRRAITAILDHVKSAQRFRRMREEQQIRKQAKKTGNSDAVDDFQEAIMSLEAATMRQSLDGNHGHSGRAKHSRKRSNHHTVKRATRIARMSKIAGVSNSTQLADGGSAYKVDEDEIKGEGLDLPMFMEIMVKVAAKGHEMEQPGLTLEEKYMGVMSWQEIAAATLITDFFAKKNKEWAAASVVQQRRRLRTLEFQVMKLEHQLGRHGHELDITNETAARHHILHDYHSWHPESNTEVLKPGTDVSPLHTADVSPLHTAVRDAATPPAPVAAAAAAAATTTSAETAAISAPAPKAVIPLAVEEQTPEGDPAIIALSDGSKKIDDPQVVDFRNTGHASIEEAMSGGNMRILL
jgi:voltage-gated sodium channel